VKDPIQIVERAYAHDAPDESAWLSAVAAAVRTNVPSFGGSLSAHTYSVREDGYVEIQTFVEEGPLEINRRFQALVVPPDVQMAIAKLHMTPGIVSARKSIWRYLANEQFREFMDRHLLAYGFEDMLMVRAFDPTRRGCFIGLRCKDVQPLHRATAGQWRRVAAHMSAGLRLRGRLAVPAGGNPPKPDDAEAILTPDGRVEHAAQAAKSASAREALKVGARAMDRARGPLRRRDPDEAVEIWRGLVAGRWSLVDHFEAGGRRYVIAHRNEASVSDPRGLTERERQIYGYAQLGASNKVIGYELGLSPSTVAVHLARAREKVRTVSGDAATSAEKKEA
jgi:DNA-binding CsgD family transcriptional regulator